MMYRHMVDTSLAEIAEDGAILRTCTVEDAGYKAWLKAGNTPLPIAPPTAEEIAAQEQAAKDAADAADAKTYTKLKALRQMSPAQVSSWVDANVTNLASAQDAIKTLAIAVSVLSRRL